MSAENPVDRLATQRLKLAESRARLASVRLELRAQLLESVRLAAAARQALVELAETRAQVAATSGAPGSSHRRLMAQPVPAADEAESDRLRLHQAYAATRDPSVMAELMASYDGFARSLAARFRRREQDDDLVQVARIGLLQAIQRFDPALGRPFLVFARATVLGELKRHIRDRTWTMRIPR
ncbi:MAG: hypothetical protein M3158_03475, partial [Pseudomonadota bacterium]|nr:hypothetical protein [Pseudomonadota bacterium]